MASRILPDTFPAKAYLLINSCSAEHPHVASWTDDGKAFVVKDTTKFAAEHLPRFFKHANFQSFVRQLNIYGFRKDAATPGAGPRDVVFRHDFFIRGREDLLDSIQRTNKKSSAAKKSAASAVATKAIPSSPSTYSSSPSVDDWDSQHHPSLQSLQQQIAEMSAKIDILLSLATHDQSNGDLPTRNGAAATSAAAGQKFPAIIGKKRRISGSQGYPSSEISLDSENDYDPLDDNRLRSDSFPRMEAVEEEKTADIEPIDIESAKQGDAGAIGGDELSEFIDNMLEEEGILDDNIAEDDDISAIENGGLQMNTCSNEARSSGGHETNEVVFRSDEAATKVAPKAIGGEEQQQYSSPGNEATIDAVITQAERVDDDQDLEAGETPIAEAVPVWHYSAWHLPGHQPPPRWARLAVLIFVVLLLVASIVVPSVVVVRNQEEKRKRQRPPPPLRPGRPGGEGGPIAEAIADAIEAGDLPSDGPVAEAIQDAIDAGIEAQKQKEQGGNDKRGDGDYGGQQRENNGDPNDFGGRNQGGTAEAQHKALFVQAFVKSKAEEKIQERDSFFEDNSSFNSTNTLHNITTTVDEVLYQCSPIDQTLI